MYSFFSVLIWLSVLAICGLLILVPKLLLLLIPESIFYAFAIHGAISEEELLGDNYVHEKANYR
ncbi:hypothetical protein [Ligilactobacillus equi]|uniref:hypothetical protein n=1 Tax=Ligilactobacillus equi TaxID=137357 RepID=UPI00138AC556|nr:hypothetical protein [Ligilactobacillus equi]